MKRPLPLVTLALSLCYCIACNKPRDTPLPAPVNGEYFFNDSEGIIYTADSNTTAKPNIFLTSDSGNHWQPVHPG